MLLSTCSPTPSTERFRKGHPTHTRARLAAAAAIALSLTGCSQLPVSPGSEESSAEIDRHTVITTHVDHVVDDDTIVVEAVEALPITDPGTNTASRDPGSLGMLLLWVMCVLLLPPVLRTQPEGHPCCVLACVV